MVDHEGLTAVSTICDLTSILFDHLETSNGSGPKGCLHAYQTERVGS